MAHIPELDPIRPQLEKFVENTAMHMGDSAICLSLFTDDYKKGMDSMLQFAIAVMMDKPLFLLVQQGTKVPEKVKKMADGIEYYQPDNKASFEQASHRLLELARQKMFVE